MSVTFIPLPAWPHESTKKRASSQFTTTYPKTLELLNRELRHLAAREVEVRLCCQAHEIRRDGFPRADARPSHPGVVVSFNGRFGPISFPCDTYSDWESNLHAIALSLEALRAVDRHGVTRHGEQYRGFPALGAGPVDPGEPAVDPEAWDANRELTVQEAAEIVTEFARKATDVQRRVTTDWRAVRADWKTFHAAHLAALRATHPDQGGNHEEFLKVKAAVTVLRRHHHV